METKRERRHEPTPAQLARISAVVRGWLQEHVESPAETGHQFYVSDITPVSGDVWVYWPHGGLALRLAGEIGMNENSLSTHLPLHLEVHHLQRQVVASLLEPLASNGALTKSWAARIIYECLVRGSAVQWDWGKE